MKQDIIKMSVKTLSHCLETKELSAVEAADAYLEQIDKKEAEIGAFLTITKEAARETAKQVDEKCTAASIVRYSIRNQGQYLHQRYSNYLCFPDAGTFYPPL